MDLDTIASKIQSRADLADFVEQLETDLEINPEPWGHLTLGGFLRVMAGSIRVLDRIYQNEGKTLSEQADWACFAEILLAARIRE